MAWSSGMIVGGPSIQSSKKSLPRVFPARRSIELQRPLPDGSLEIAARGVKEDGSKPWKVQRSEAERDADLRLWIGLSAIRRDTIQCKVSITFKPQPEALGQSLQWELPNELRLRTCPHDTAHGFRNAWMETEAPKK